MERYESKHVQILQPASMIYGVLSDFNHLTPVLGDKVEGWSATTDTCSFKAQGFQINLQMVEKVAPKLIKVTGADGSPMDFTFGYNWSASAIQIPACALYSMSNCR